MAESNGEGMKARLLKNLLNDTGYLVANYGKYIGVGSPLCHNLFSVDKATLTLNYALSFGREDVRDKFVREGNAEFIFIWDKLRGLIDNGQMREIINGVDEIENPLPVFTVSNRQLIETFTDAYGYPNLTINGDQMYDNSWFDTKEKAIEYGKRESESAIKMYGERANDLEADLHKVRNEIQEHFDFITTH